MTSIKLAEKIAKKYSVTTEKFIQSGIVLSLKEKKKKYLIEKFEIISKYRVDNAHELKEKIEQGKVKEHPAWEDFIEIKNIEKEIEGIENDLESISEI